MTPSRLGFTVLLLTVALPALAQDTAAALLARAVAAFENNQKNETQWNWNIIETRRLLNRSGQLLQNFPSVASESVIRSDGRRCNAITAWGDGRAPYLKNADPDERCQAFNSLGTPFRVGLLLKSTHASVIGRTASAIAISILPDRSRANLPDYDVRCAASIEATVQLDPATFFPLRIEGEVALSGCDGKFQPVVHYETLTREPMVSQFRRGASFHVVYELQRDRFDNPANAFWIGTEQHFVQPWKSDSRVLYYWGRQVPVSRDGGYRLVKDIKTTAREFGAGSQLRFDK